MRILISGAGIAGPTLAYWLARYGFTITLLEKAPCLRTGGYIVDFWGAGFDVAERMGMLPEITANGYKIEEIRVVNENGQRVAGFPANAFSRMTHDRFTSLPRGELAAALFRKIQGSVEVIFGDNIANLQEFEQGVRVVFEKGMEREFDLVIGADGLHSRVRQLAFGEQRRFEKYLGYKVAAFSVAGYRPRDELVYVMYTEVGQQIVRFAMRDDRTMFLLTFADAAMDDVAPGGAVDAKLLLRKRYARSGWECAQILEWLNDCGDLYFDRVSQIQMDTRYGWSRGRVALVGDAAFCVSLLAGQGCALAMIAAYILAGELHRARGAYQQAFARYQERFGPFILKKQNSALRFAGTFAPKSKISLVFRNQVMNLMSIPWIADLVVGRDVADRIEVPEY